METKPSQLTLEQHGTSAGSAFFTVIEFWDCECGDGPNDFSYIHRNVEGVAFCDQKCPICGNTYEEMPNSRLNEVLAAYPELNQVPWHREVFRNGETITLVLTDCERQQVVGFMTAYDRAREHDRRAELVRGATA